MFYILSPTRRDQPRLAPTAPVAVSPIRAREIVTAQRACFLAALALDRRRASSAARLRFSLRFPFARMADHDDDRMHDDDNPRRAAGDDRRADDRDERVERDGPHPRDLPGVTVLVRNISWDAREDDVRALFEPHGNVLDVYMPKDYQTKRPKGLAFVKYAVQNEADNAIAACNDARLLDREIRCEIAQGKAKSADEFRAQAPRRDDRRDFNRRDDRRDDRRGGYDDRRGGHDDRRGGYDDRRGGFDDRRGGFDDRRGGFDDRRGGDRRGGGSYERRDDRPYAPRGDRPGGDRPRGLCYDFRDGKCQRGDSCRFSHDDAAR